MSFFDEYTKAVSAVAKVISNAVKDTEKEIDRPMTEDEKKFYVASSLLYLFVKYGPRKENVDGKSKENV